MKKIDNKVEIQALQLQKIKVSIEGITPLLMEKMDMDVVERYNLKKGKKMSEKDTELEEDKYEAKKYINEAGDICFPIIAFHKGMVEVAPYIDGLDKKKVRGSIRILGDLVPLKYSQEVKNIKWGRTSGMTKAPRKIIRPEFKDWSCELEVIFNSDNLSAEQVINLLNWAGFQIGVGGFRPEKSGNFGQYKVAISKNQ